MTIAQFATNGPNWVELPVGADVVLLESVASYATLLMWSNEERASFGIKPIVEPEVPANKVATASHLSDVNGEPHRVLTLEDAPPAPVPESVTAAQARLALYDADLLDDVEGLVAVHPYAPLRIWFNHAKDWERGNPYIQALAPELNLTETEVDDLFTAAALKV